MVQIPPASASPFMQPVDLAQPGHSLAEQRLLLMGRTHSRRCGIPCHQQTQGWTITCRARPFSWRFW